MKNLLVIAGLGISIIATAQIDKDKLALDISKAEEANTESLKEYIWKRKSDISVNGEVKLTTYTQFNFDAQDKLQAQIVDAESNVKQKGGLRGRAQKNAAEDKLEYVQKTLELAVAYTYMTKGQLLDFISKATVTDKGNVIEATGSNVYVQGDKLTVLVDPKTHLFTKKTFSSFVGKDPVDGDINYEKFSSGVSHGSTTILNMPAEKMKINAVNQDYSKKVK